MDATVWSKNFVGDEETIKLRGKIEMKLDEASQRLEKLKAKIKDIAFTYRRLSEIADEPSPERIADHAESILILLKTEGLDWSTLTEQSLASLAAELKRAANDLNRSKQEKAEFLQKPTN